MKSGGISALGWTRDSHSVLGWLPPGTFRRALTLGFVTLIVVGPLAVLALHVLSVDQLAFGPFIIFKSVFAGLLALVVTPVISIWALAEPA